MSNLNLTFQIRCSETKFGEEVFLLGNCNELGNWDIQKSKKLSTDSDKFPLWESDVVIFPKNLKFEYKYIIKNSSSGIKWENFQGNRNLNLSSYSPDNYIVNDGNFNFNTNPIIERLNKDKKISRKKIR